MANITCRAPGARRDQPSIYCSAMRLYVYCLYVHRRLLMQETRNLAVLGLSAVRFSRW